MAEDEMTEQTAKRPFSGTFVVPAGELLMISQELAEQLPELIGRSYRDIRTSMGVTTRGGSNAPKLSMTDDGLAVISLIGPMTRYQDLCADLFGGVSTQDLMTQLQAAEDDPACRGVLLVIDSPGGQAAGIHDLADAIYSMRETTPVVAYIDNLAGSAAYWPASAANAIVMSPAAFVGSIGVVTTVYKGTDKSTVEIVSSKSPKKRPDISTDSGRAQIQTRIDDLADVFIQSVAKHRNVQPQTVEDDFGQGDVVIAAKAIAAGMADRVGDMSDALAELRALADRSQSDINRFGRLGPNSDNSQGDDNMAENAGANANTAVPITTVEQLTAAYGPLVAIARRSSFGLSSGFSVVR